MKRNWNIETVKLEFSKRGYILISTEYNRVKDKLKIQCPKGHISDIIFHNFINGKGCWFCGRERRLESTRYNYEEVKLDFKLKGYTLLSKNYKNSSTKLDYICPQGHSGSITYNSFKKDYGCKQCSVDNQRNSYINIRKQFELRSYTLLSKEYKNRKSKLKYICPIGHGGEISYNHFNTGKGCAICGGSSKHSYDKVKKCFESRNYILISTEYINEKQKLKFICPSGHNGEMTYTNFRSGHGCYKCRNDIISEKLRKYDLSEDERIRTRRYKGYSLWRHSVLKRDNYQCIITKKTGEVAAHHLDSHCTFPDKRISIENGVTLLKNIHLEFHSIFGQITTKDDFEKYKIMKQIGEI